MGSYLGCSFCCPWKTYALSLGVWGKPQLKFRHADSFLTPLDKILSFMQTPETEKAPKT
jgi:hypothetical protein